MAKIIRRYGRVVYKGNSDALQAVDPTDDKAVAEAEAWFSEEAAKGKQTRKDASPSKRAENEAKAQIGAKRANDALQEKLTAELQKKKAAESKTVINPDPERRAYRKKSSR